MTIEEKITEAKKFNIEITPNDDGTYVVEFGVAFYPSIPEAKLDRAIERGKKVYEDRKSHHI